ncbi:transferase hexapeptide repeat family protein [Azospirillum soli]|uniref:acyltransferase n=1 Tax=Azospirillum soli TaxID=1304799 RepID=UPI001AE24B2B|nr:transferase hexapeptide repeat family protein [Azospirillum soli]MBP2316838.1 phenylacetic acid degradation protein [Azospirillum soli]
MANIYAFEGLRPVVDPSSFVHPTATLIGDVIIGPNCFVGPGAVMRGDFGRLILEASCNLQDNCVVHSYPGRESVVHELGHIGHGAILHGCTVGRNALVGMGAVVMDNVVVGEEAFVGALSFVASGMAVPPRTLVIGRPAKVTRELSAGEVARKTRGTGIYVDLAARFARSMVPCTPLAAPEPDRPRLDDLKVTPLGFKEGR